MVKSIVKTSIETTREGNVLVFDPSRTFGNKKTMGMQYKGSAVIDGKEQFVKLDVINPEVKGRWENHFDYENSSVTESIVGALVKNMDADPNFESVIYTFGEFQTPTRKFTGTYSENFLRENEIEMILSTSTQSDAHTTCSLDEYVESVIDTNPENRYNHLLSLLKNRILMKQRLRNSWYNKPGSIFLQVIVTGLIIQVTLSLHTMLIRVKHVLSIWIMAVAYE